MKKLYLFVSLFCLVTINQGICQIKINEVLASNLTVNYDSYFNYESWIELYNSGTNTQNIGGFYLSNDKKNLKKWKVPNGTSISGQSYLIIWCNNKNSGTNTNFNIDPGGSGLYLSNITSGIIDSITIPSQYPNVSYGRVANGNKWAFLADPTPSALNEKEEVFGRLSRPEVSLPSGRYPSAITVSIKSSVYGNIQIRYTTDGSEPDKQSSLYTNPILINKTLVLKCKAFHAGTIPSPTVTHTYLINEHSVSLPVVSVSMDPAFLTSNTIGIYVEGLNGISGNCSDLPRNWNRGWDRACTVQIFDKQGQEMLNQELDASIAGNCSRTAPQKSVSLEARKKFEDGSIDLKLFPSKGIKKYEAFVLRNSGNDFWNTMMRDGLMQTLLADRMDIDYQAFQPSVVYMNGQYWGVMNIREKVDADYIRCNYSVPADSIDFLEDNASVVEGSSSAYNAFLGKLQSIDISKKEAYDYIDTNMDVDNFIHYYIAEIYYGNTDWPGNNIKYWKYKRPGGKWRWIMFDTDFGFAIYADKSTATHKTLHFVTDSTSTVSWPNPKWSTLLFRRLLKNPTFKARFIQTYTSSFTTVFAPKRIHHYIDSLSGLIASEIVYHKKKWGGSVSDWTNEVKKLHTFADQRYSFFIPYFADFFKLNLNDRINVNASVFNSDKGNVYVNGIKVSPYDTLSIFKGIPLELEAKPSSGFRFKRWTIQSKTSSVVTSYSVSAKMIDTVGVETSYVAEFEAVSPVGSLFVNEISAKDSYVKDDYNETTDWFELYNGCSDTIDLTGLYLTDDFKDPCKYKIWNYNLAHFKMTPYAYHTFWADDDAYKGINHCPFKLYGKGEQLGIFQIIGNDTLCVDSITYGKQKARTSYCRFPDGADYFISTNVLTPSAANKPSANIPLGSEVLAEPKLSIYPNPAVDHIFVEIPGLVGSFHYSICNITGKVIDEGISSNAQDISCTRLQQGIYILKISSKRQTYIIRFMKIAY